MNISKNQKGISKISILAIVSVILLVTLTGSIIFYQHKIEVLEEEYKSKNLSLRNKIETMEENYKEELENLREKIEKEKIDGEPKIYDISPSEARTIIEGDNILVLDVRTSNEFENSHIHGALLLPVSEINDSTILRTLPRDKPILVYCRSGTRSTWAADYLYHKGFIRIYNLSGGIIAWEKRGYPTTEGRETPPSCPCVVN